MTAIQFAGNRPYLSPSSRMIDIHVDQNFLASGDFGGNGYPGDDMDPGEEYNF